MKSDPAKVAGIILAAGLSSRMGSAKLALPFQGRPILHHVVRAAVASDLDPVIVVLGHNHEQLVKHMPRSGAEIEINSRYREGMSTSLKAGLTRLGDRALGALFLLGDQPLVKIATLNRIVRGFCETKDKTHPLIVAPRFNHRRGNPVLFHRDLFPELRSLTGDTGGREIIWAFSDRVCLVDVADPGISLDVDTPSDYEALTSCYGENG